MTMAKVIPEPDRFKVTLRALDVLLKLAASNKGIRSATGAEQERQASRYLLELERAFGCRIRKHGSNPTVLTAEAHELAKIASSYAAALEEFHRKCKSLPPKITIAAGDSVVNWIILPALKNILAGHNIFFSVRQGGTKGLITLLHESQIDFAILPQDAPLEKKWECEILGTYEYCICCPKSLLGETVLNKESASRLDFALMTDHWKLDFVEKARHAGMQLNVKIKCETFTQIASLVRTGSFAGILPLSTMSSFSSKSYQWFKPDFMKETDRKINLVWKPDGAHIKSHVNEIAPPLLKQLRSELTAKQNI